MQLSKVHPRPVQWAERKNRTAIDQIEGAVPRGSLMDYHAAIERYYKAFRDRDRDTLRSLLTADFHFVSSFAEYRDRDAMLDEIWPAVGRAWATHIRIFGQGPELVVLYRHENAPGVERPSTSMAEYVRFEGDRIAEIEVFQGRPAG